MAVSPAHRFGQIIGEILEMAVFPLLSEFAKKYGLYLDTKGKRSTRKGTKCTWVDLNGNAHDLDFVLERGSTRDKPGTPVAFIETAWRRYTKHSRNKAQEIQGALMPLIETYSQASPFAGVILGGVFTEGALTQLKSIGFTVLFFPYGLIVKVFDRFGIDAHFDEKTPDAVFKKKVNAYKKLSKRKRTDLARALMLANNEDIQHFVEALTVAVLREIESVIVLPLHGRTYELKTIDDAVKFIEDYDEMARDQTVQCYEIQIRYSNGDRIDAKFQDKTNSLNFLRGYRPIDPELR